MILPQRETGIVVQTNMDGADSSKLAMDLMRILIAAPAGQTK
jgi:hypothetical protein